MKNSILKFRHSLIALLMTVLCGAAASAAAPWGVDPGDYRYDMSLYLDVVVDGAGMDYTEYEMAAFCGDECRGVAEVLPLAGGRQCLYMRVRSNQTQGETMTFRYRDVATGRIRDVEGASFAFESDGRLGYPSDPFVVNVTRMYDVGVSAGPGGAVDQQGGRLQHGSVITVTATPDEGWRFVRWSDGVTDNPRTIVVTDDLELTAEFAAEQYRLVYLVDETLYKETYLDFGAAVIPEEAPVREGHSFSGWAGLPETMPAHDVTVEGTFTVNSYKATFTIDGEAIETRLFDFGAEVTAPDAPAREGHTFAGWSGVPASMPAHDIVVTGVYVADAYTLTYMVDGEVYRTSVLEYGATVVPESAPVKEGHTFGGWTGLPEKMPAHDVTVEGTFTVNSYKATFSIDGQVIETRLFVFGTEVTAPDAPAREGYTFAEWRGMPAIMPAHDIEVSGAYSVNTYTLTYMIDGEVYRTSVLEYGEAVIPEDAPVREGETFSGWAGLPETMPAHDVTVNGTFSVSSFRAVFLIGGEVFETRFFDCGAPVTTPDAPEKEGYTFSGWRGVPQAMPAHDIEITGEYTANTYTLTYMVDGEVYMTSVLGYGAAITPIEALAKEGYTFSGWSGLPETMPAHDVTVEGVFTVNSYLATFTIDGETVETRLFGYGAEVTAPDAPAKEGHTFIGWRDVPAAMPAHDIVVTGTYAVNSYTLTYMVDGEVYMTSVLEYGAAVIPAEAPSREGCSFSGWAGLPETMPARDVTVNGRFSVNSYMVTFIIDGETFHTRWVRYGSDVTVPTAPEREGCEFSGWQNVPDTMPAHDIVITGSYSTNHYTLTLYLNGEVYSTMLLEYGEEILLPEPEVPEGMKFDGWTGDIPETMPAHDVEVYGTCSPVTSVGMTAAEPEGKVTVYSISGQKVYEGEWTGANMNLAPGLYIVNGRKVIIR